MARRPPQRAGSRRRRRARRRAWPILAAALLTAAICLVLGRQQVQVRAFGFRPDMIIIHHSATPPAANGHRIDAAAIDAMHDQRGFSTEYRGKVYHIGYHYLILPDGEVQPGRPEGCIGAHARHVNAHALGICLVGNFSSAHNPTGKQGPLCPSKAQMDALVRLCAHLMRKYHIPHRNVLRHRDVAPTACPGDRFPYQALQAALRRQVPEIAPAPEPWWRRLWHQIAPPRPAGEDACRPAPGEYVAAGLPTAPPPAGSRRPPVGDRRELWDFSERPAGRPDDPCPLVRQVREFRQARAHGPSPSLPWPRIGGV